MREYRTGEIIDDEYKMLSALGGGAFGIVLRVERLLDGREYAMKLFHATAARDLVQRELKALQAVNHPKHHEGGLGGPTEDSRVPPDADFTRWSPDVDLFAAGAVVYELACGNIPYASPDGNIIDPQRLRPGMPVSLERFLVRACAPSSDQRFRSATEMRAALAEVADGFASSETIAARADAAAALLMNGGYFQEYTSWDERPLPGASGSTTDAIVECFLEIVAAEGPILCKRLYELYTAASGDPGVASVKRYLNRAAYAAVRDGRLSQLEPLGGGQADKTVFLPDTESFIVRERGPRPILHIPPSEVQALAKRLSDEEQIPDEDLLVGLQEMYYADDTDGWEMHYLVSRE